MANWTITLVLIKKLDAFLRFRYNYIQSKNETVVNTSINSRCDLYAFEKNQATNPEKIKMWEDQLQEEFDTYFTDHPFLKDSSNGC